MPITTYNKCRYIKGYKSNTYSYYRVGRECLDLYYSISNIYSNIDDYSYPIDESIASNSTKLELKD